MTGKSRCVLGIDIGTESVGSAWVDLEAKEFDFAVSIFPRGVEDREGKRSAPKNQARRQARSQRRSIARRALRKRWLRRHLTDAGLCPSASQPADHDVHSQTPWELRRKGLLEPLTPHEFGRVLTHLNQRRGALGVSVDDEEDADAEKAEKEEKEDSDGKQVRELGKIKKAISRLGKEIGDRTFGQFMADKYDDRKHAMLDKRGAKKDKQYHSAIRNRRDALDRDEGYHATRDMIRTEFRRLWEAQKKLAGLVAPLLTNELKKLLDDPTADAVWREKGVIFGQRRTYWDTGTLRRCDLEPSDLHCPHADRHMQEFRVLETVNNIRVKYGNEERRPLNEKERAKVIARLRSQTTADRKTIRAALGINKKKEPFFSLNLDADPERKINTDWFYCSIVLRVFGQNAWEAMSEQKRESVNRAILKFDPDKAEHAAKLTLGARSWWNLSDDDKVDNLLKAWRKRPKLRANLSRRAIQNLLPLMRRCNPAKGCWPTLEEAKQEFAEDPDSGATLEQRVRYAPQVTTNLRALLCRLVGEERAKELLRLRGTNKRDRHYMQRHPEKILPPAPMLANPVVRKAIHEVRRHVIAWIRKFGRKPDQIVVELIREARQSAKVRRKILLRNRFREMIRKEIEKQYNLGGLKEHQRKVAVDRVLLLRQQRGVCAYSGESSGPRAYTGKPITEPQAVDGTGLEIDHIVPKSLSQDNGLNNKVLCYKNPNASKGQQTPKDWLAPERYAAMLQRFAHLKKERPEKGTYFFKKDNARKWENLNRRTPDTSDFLKSQYTDTAYAAKQVRRWLTGVLYAGEKDAANRVVPTNGRVTAALRKDWQLQDSDKPKDRTDHRHHALDALVIALSDLNLQGFLASLAAQERFHKQHGGQWPRRKPVDPPWGTVEEFRAQVFNRFRQLIVWHRPVKRRLVGELHEATAYGKAHEYPGLYTFHIRASELEPRHLRPPKKNVARNGTVTYRIEGKGQNSVVRSSALQKAIRRCLRDNGLDPEHFTEKDIKALTDPADYKLRFHKSGVPIYDITMVRTMKKPLILPPPEQEGGDDCCAKRGRKRENVRRYYVRGKNHHVEVLEDVKTGKWKADCVDMFTAAARVKPPGKHKRQPMVNRDDRPGKRFVMSLAKGETLYMKSPPMERTKVEEYDYFVVAKIDEKNVYLLHHTDARPAKPRKNPKTGVPEEARELIPKSVEQIRHLCLPSGEPPKKVRLNLPAYKDVPESIHVLRND